MATHLLEKEEEHGLLVSDENGKGSILCRRHGNFKMRHQVIYIRHGDHLVRDPASRQSSEPRKKY